LIVGIENPFRHPARLTARANAFKGGRVHRQFWQRRPVCLVAVRAAQFHKQFPPPSQLNRRFQIRVSRGMAQSRLGNGFRAKLRWRPVQADEGVALVRRGVGELEGVLAFAQTDAFAGFGGLALAGGFEDDVGVDFEFERAVQIRVEHIAVAQVHGDEAFPGDGELARWHEGRGGLAGGDVKQRVGGGGHVLDAADGEGGEQAGFGPGLVLRGGSTREASQRKRGQEARNGLGKTVWKHRASVLAAAAGAVNARGGDISAGDCPQKKR